MNTQKLFYMFTQCVFTSLLILGSFSLVSAQEALTEKTPAQEVSSQEQHSEEDSQAEEEPVPTPPTPETPSPEAESEASEEETTPSTPPEASSSETSDPEPSSAKSSDPKVLPPPVMTPENQTKSASTSKAKTQGLHLGIGGGAYLPTGDAQESYDVSPGFHGTLLIGLKDLIKFEGELGCWILRDSLDNFSASYSVLTGGVRLYPSSGFHLDAGFGVYRAKTEWTTVTGSRADYLEKDSGAYIGTGIELDAFDLKIRAHSPDFDDFFIGGTLTYLFDMWRLFR
jgi:hypothetical protein